MTIPDYQTVMLPLLSELADDRDHRLAELVDRLNDRFNLSPDERTELLPSGSVVIYNRVAWAKSYLKQAGLIESRSRGTSRITPEGQELLRNPPERITEAYLRRYDSFRAFLDRNRKPPKGRLAEARDDAASGSGVQAQTPEEAMESSARELKQQVADDLLDKVRGCSPAFFERLVVTLLVAMGYGGSKDDAVQSVGRTGDGGIDGIIKEDKLGLDAVYVQAKKWEEVVGRPVVQAFAGSLEGARARKGVLLSTSSFSREAREYADRIEKRIVLVDGAMLADLMIEHGVGVTVAREYQIHRLDIDFFEETSV
jgi:restriction system protein